MTRPVRHCGFPGCGARLNPNAPGYGHGVCKAHRHAQDFCLCVKCAGQRKRPREVSPDALRVVDVPAFSGYSRVGETVRVSLPREPWMRGDA
jgi:hypothetical protein